MKKKIVALTAIAVLSVGTAAQAAASSVHTVQSGDTLWSISQDNNVSVQNLQVWNELDSTLIYPDQNLKVEDKLETYVVVKGDSLYKIATENNISVNELMDWNNLSSHLIFPGDEFVLQGTKVAAANKTVQKATAPAPTAAPVQKAATAPVAVNAPASSTQGKEMTVTATAYTAYCTGCSGTTATGIDLRANPNLKVIAVDPKVIPLGSRVWVEGYGEAIAGDTGGAIKGNIIDLFMKDRQDALNWGRRTITIKVLD